MQQTRPRQTLKVRDLVTGKTMTVEEWKRHKEQIAAAIAADMASQLKPAQAKEQACQT